MSDESNPPSGPECAGVLATDAIPIETLYNVRLM